MAGKLEGKVALISGAARGIGAHDAERFVAEGARVVVGDVLEDDGRALADRLGAAASFIALDVTSEASWQAAVADAEQRHGRLDVLVNNAGILRTGAIEHTSLEDFEAVLRVNLVGTFLGIKTVAPAMRRAGGGSIVNVSSLAGLVGAAGVPAYVASKFGVRGLTKAAALELGHSGIRVNSIHPGGIDTAMTRGAGLTEEERAREFARYPIPRVGQPDEVANLVVFLASDDSAFCTGGEYAVDGGASAGRVTPGLGEQR